LKYKTQDQLAKPEPNKSIIDQLWGGLQKVAVAAGVADACQKVAPLVQQLLAP